MPEFEESVLEWLKDHTGKIAANAEAYAVALRKPRALGRGPFGGGGVRGAAAAALRLRGQPTTPGAAPQRGPLKNEKKSAAAMAANPAAVTLRVQILQSGVLYI